MVKKIETGYFNKGKTAIEYTHVQNPSGSNWVKIKIYAWG